MVLGVIAGVFIGSAATYYMKSSKTYENETQPQDEETPTSDDEPASRSRSLELGSSSVQSRSINASSSSPKSSSAYAAALSSSGSGGLLTGIMAQLWSHMNKAIAKSVKETVEPMFAEMLPGPLASLHFTKLDLGSVPIRMDNIIVHEEKNDSVQFDFDITWDGDCAIELKADYVGSFGIQSVKLFGRMSVLLAPLAEELPVVGAVQYCFINPPTVELDFTGLANLADSGLLSTKIRAIIQDSLQSIMVLPNRMLSKLDPTNDFLETYRPPVGICRVRPIRGEGFKVEKGVISSDVPDVYCKFTLGGKEWKTTTIKDSKTPEWSVDECGDFVLSDHDQIVSIECFDEDKGALDGDDYIGGAKVTVGEVLLAGKQVSVDLHGGDYDGAKVTLRCDILPLSSNLDSLASNKSEHLLSGFLTILVTRAENLPVSKEEAASFVKVKYGGDDGDDDSKFEFVTPTVATAEGIDALNPVYDSVFHIPLTPKLMESKHPVVLELINGTDTVLGTTTLTHDDLVNAQESTITEKRAIGDEGASIKFRVSLQGVEQPTGMPSRSDETKVEASATSSSVTHGNALGTVRLTAVKGWGFVPEKRRLHRKDIPDVYCNVTFGSSPNVWKTCTIKNSCEPEWNESSDYLMSDHSQIVTISVFDEDTGHGDDDDALGSARITVGKLLLSGGRTDIELEQDGKPTGCYVSFGCEMIG